MAIPTKISDLSVTAASNNPQGSENIGNTLDDYMRAYQSIIRQESLDKEWVTPATVPVYVSATSIKVSGSDVTGIYIPGRRVKITGSVTGTIYGKILTSVFSTDTTITILFDSGSLSNEALTTLLSSFRGGITGALPGSNRSFDFDLSTLHGGNVASASTINLDQATGNIIDITGTTDISTITLAEGRLRTVRFTGILNLINSSNLAMPNAANLATADGDFAIFVGYASGVVRCVMYFNANLASYFTKPYVAPVSGLLNIQSFTSSTTYTKTSGTNKVLVEVLGGGGGGGSGSGSSVVGDPGSSGGTSSFGSHVSAPGGNGGGAGRTGGQGGSGSNSGSGGFINILGSKGNYGNTISGGNGANSYLGGNGGGGISGSINGIQGGPGAGGGGGFGTSNGSGGGGGSGGYGRAFITSGIGTTETITIGAGGGSGGNGGVGNGVGGSGGSGVVIVYEYS